MFSHVQKRCVCVCAHACVGGEEGSEGQEREGGEEGARDKNRKGTWDEGRRIS